MEDSSFSWDLFDALPIIGIIRGINRDKLEHVLPLYQAAGFTNVEITLNTPDALSIIQWLNENFGNQMNVGAGTVCSMEDLDRAIEVGAQFIVSPIFDAGLINACTATGVPVFPGAFSPTEIYQAWQAGASMVKVFPATLGGADYIKQIKGPLNQIKLLPTGGVTMDNLSDFLKAGADGFGIGGEIFDKTLIQDNQWSQLEEKMKAFMNKFKASVY